MVAVGEVRGRVAPYMRLRQSVAVEQQHPAAAVLLRLEMRGAEREAVEGAKRPAFRVEVRLRRGADGSAVALDGAAENGGRRIRVGRGPALQREVDEKAAGNVCRSCRERSRREKRGEYRRQQDGEPSFFQISHLPFHKRTAPVSETRARFFRIIFSFVFFA